VEEEHDVDDDVRPLESLDRSPVARERGRADRPHADLAADAERRLGQPELERGRAKTARRGEERVDVTRALVALGDDHERLVLADGAQPKLLLAQIDEGGVAEDGSSFPSRLVRVDIL
jgi:hypothetical protein